MRFPSSWATKRSAEQNADFVPGHKIGQFLQLGFVKRAPGIGGGLVNGVDGEVLKCAAVLHDCPPWAGLVRGGDAAHGWFLRF
jgi:hypothetical protein